MKKNSTIMLWKFVSASAPNTTYLGSTLTQHSSRMNTSMNIWLQWRRIKQWDYVLLVLNLTGILMLKMLGDLKILIFMEMYLSRSGTPDLDTWKMITSALQN